MTCEELREHYEMYALGIADEPERAEIRAHLNRGCEVCMGGVKRAIELAALLGGTVPAAAPSSKLRRRILASVGYEQGKFGWTPFFAGATVLCLAAAVYFSGREREFANDLVRMQEHVRVQTAELTHLNDVILMLNSPDTVETSFGEKQPARGKVFSNKSGVLLIANSLAPAPAGKMYEMWVIPKGARPQPAGMFQAGANGTAMHMWHRDMSAGDTVAVTMEAQSGVDAPTGTILIFAPLPGL